MTREPAPPWCAATSPTPAPSSPWRPTTGSSCPAARTGPSSSSTAGPRGSCSGSSWKTTCSPCPTGGRSSGPGTTRAGFTSSGTAAAASSPPGISTWGTGCRSRGSGTRRGPSTPRPPTGRCGYTSPRTLPAPSAPGRTTTSLMGSAWRGTWWPPPLVVSQSRFGGSGPDAPPRPHVCTAREWGAAGAGGLPAAGGGPSPLPAISHADPSVPPNMEETGPRWGWVLPPVCGY